MGFVKHIPVELSLCRRKKEPLKKNNNSNTVSVIVSGDRIHSNFGVELVTMENLSSVV